MFAFCWADSISQFEPSYIHTTVRRTHTNTHTLHAYMTGGPCHLGARAATPPANTTGPALAGVPGRHALGLRPAHGPRATAAPASHPLGMCVASGSRWTRRRPAKPRRAGGGAASGGRRGSVGKSREGRRLRRDCVGLSERFRSLATKLTPNFYRPVQQIFT